MFAGDLDKEVDLRREAIRLGWQKLDEIPLGTIERHEASQAIKRLVADLEAFIRRCDEAEADERSIR